MSDAAIGQLNVAGRVVVLTGGAGLLGATWARDLSAAGAHVVVADREGAAAQEVAATVPGAAALGVACDVTDPADVARLVEATVGAFGQVDALVNAAAIDPKFDATSATGHQRGFEAYPLAAWRLSMEVNLTGPFLCAQAFLPHLQARQGTIVNITSTYGLVAPDQRLYDDGSPERGFKPASYAVTKAGLLGLTRYLAAYYGPAGVRVNALAPGGVEAGHDAGFVTRYASRTPLGRMARREEYSQALMFLISPGSSYMTGACLVVDGGWTAW